MAERKPLGQWTDGSTATSLQCSSSARSHSRASRLLSTSPTREASQGSFSLEGTHILPPGERGSRQVGVLSPFLRTPKPSPQYRPPTWYKGRRALLPVGLSPPTCTPGLCTCHSSWKLHDRSPPPLAKLSPQLLAPFPERKPAQPLPWEKSFYKPLPWLLPYLLPSPCLLRPPPLSQLPHHQCVG